MYNQMPDGLWPTYWRLGQLNRFIVISFLIMGFGYYELSGGAGFEPEVRPIATLDEATAQQDALPAAADPVPAQVVAVQPVPNDPVEVVADQAGVEPTDLAAATNEVGAELPVFRSLSEPAGAAVLTGIPARAPSETPSETPSDPTLVPVSTTEPAELPELETDAGGDVRWVDASGLNVRSGPSTGSSVLTSLERSEFVLVIREQTDGWALVRVEGDGTEGWVASRFLAR